MTEHPQMHRLPATIGTEDDLEELVHVDALGRDEPVDDAEDEAEGRKEGCRPGGEAEVEHDGLGRVNGGADQCLCPAGSSGGGGMLSCAPCPPWLWPP